MTAPLALTPEDLAYLEQAEALLRARADARWCPHRPTERQAAFLARDELEVLFGGAAGGGKSDALLMGALEYVDHPGYAALLLRQTYADLSLPGALMDRAAEWLRPTAAEWSDRTKTWHFPSGASLSFGYLEHDKDRFRYQGAELQYIGFDELTQFSEVRYTYLLSRLRRADGAQMPLRARGATNPGGLGHEWVKRRWGLDERGEQDPEQATDEESGEMRVFVPSKLSDNPHVDQVEYGKALARLDSTTRAQLEEGLWVQDHTGLVLPLTRANLLPVAPQHGDMRHVLCIDMGTSEAEETLAIAVVGWSPTVPDEAYVLHAEKHAGLLIAELAERVRELDARFGVDRMLMDEGALGSGFGRELRMRHGLPIQAAEKRNRLGYARLFRDAAKAAHVDARPGVTRLYVVADDAAPLVEEAAALFWHDDGKRMVGACHAYDASMYAYRATRPWAAKAPPPAGPQPGTEEHARQWAAEHKRKVAKREADKRKRVWWQR